MSDSNPTTEDLEKSLSLSNSQSKALKKLTQKWGEMMDSTKEELHRETKYPFLYYLLRVSLLGIPLWLLYAQYGFFFGLNTLYVTIYNLLYEFGGFWVYTQYGILYIAGLSILFVIVVGYEVFAASINILFAYNTKRHFERYQKEFIIFFIAIAFFLILGYMSEHEIGFNSVQGEFENPLNATYNTFSKLFEEIGCSLKTECVLNRKAQKELKSSSQTQYSISFKRPEPSEFLLSDIKDNGIFEWPLEYRVQAQGGKMYMKSIRCYQDKITNQTLLSYQDLNNRELKYDEVKTFSTSCDISSINLNKTKTVKIIPVLEFTLTTKYSEDIIYIDATQMSRDEIEKAEESNQAESLESNNLFKVSRTFSPKSPLIFEDFTSKNVLMLYSFSKENSHSSFGKIKSSKLEKIEVPSYFNSKEEIETPKELIVTDSKTATLRLSFDANLPDNNKEITKETLVLEISSIVARENDFFYITLRVPEESSQTIS